MKSKLVFVFIIVFYCIVATAQPVEIRGVFSNSPDPEVLVQFPVDGRQFLGAHETLLIDTSTGRVSGNIDIIKPGFLTLSNNWKSIKLFVTPGKSYEVNMDFKNPHDVEIKGYEAAGQQLLQQLGLYTDTRLDIKDLDAAPSVNDRLKIADKIINDKKARIQTLFADKRIGNDFYNAVFNQLEVYRVNLLATNFFFEYRATEGKQKDSLKRKMFFQDYMPVWTKLYSAINRNYEWLTASGYPELLERYDSYQDLKDSSKLVFLPGNYAINIIDDFKKTLKGDMLEYAWANYIVIGINENKFEVKWVNNFEEFKNKFPKSELIPYLLPYINKVIAYNSPDKKKIKEIKFLKGYENIKTANNLFGSLKGKVSYMDIWATWCGPCREELQYSIAMHDTFNNLGIQVVYLSIDTDNADELWKDMIFKLGLKGVNIRTSGELHAELNSLIPKFTGIPRYLIVDKKGKVVEWDAKRPSDKLELVRQLKQYTEL